MLGMIQRRAIARGENIGTCQAGLALVEFALSLPILLTLGLVGLETANFAMAHLRVSNIAMMTADNAARVRESIDEADVIGLLVGAKATGEGIGFAQNGRIILSSIEVNSAGNGQWIRWQRCDGAKTSDSEYGAEDTGRNNASLQAVGPPGNQIAAQPGTAVMVVEVVYDYQPIVARDLMGDREIRYISAFNVRQRTNQAITNLGNATPRRCNVYQA
jgi:hypothetical protein